MKQVIKCRICGSWIRKNKTYKVGMEGYREIESFKADFKEEGRICPDCNKKVGYKGKKEII
jgi:ribosomal protein L32